MNATAVRVPVFYGHSEVVHIETRRKTHVPPRRAHLLEKAPGVTVLDERAPGRVPDGGYRGSEPRHSLCRENS